MTIPTPAEVRQIAQANQERQLAERRAENAKRTPEWLAIIERELQKAERPETGYLISFSPYPPPSALAIEENLNPALEPIGWKLEGFWKGSLTLKDIQPATTCPFKDIKAGQHFRVASYTYLKTDLVQVTYGNGEATAPRNAISIDRFPFEYHFDDEQIVTPVTVTKVDIQWQHPTP